jgi:hypothetical protein
MTNKKERRANRKAHIKAAGKHKMPDGSMMKDEDMKGKMSKGKKC